MTTERNSGMDRWDTLGQAWIGLLRHVWVKGEAGLDERGPIIEAPPYLFEIASLSRDDPLLRAHARRISPRAQAALTKDSWPVRLRELQGVDQLSWVVRTLRARPWSTRGWIPLTVPGDPEEEMPTLTAVAFRIAASGPRSGALVMTATFRAQDAVTSHLAYLPLRAVQAEVAERLGLPLGPLRIFVDVPHVYVVDAEEVARVLTAIAEAA